MSNSTVTKKHINTTKKIINIMKEINKIDEILKNKYERNTNEIELYDSLLIDTNNNFYNIIKNLK